MTHPRITTLAMARSGHNFVLQNVLSWLDNHQRYVHHNLESIDPARLTTNHLKHGGIKLLIYRDFDDWLASLIMKSYKNRPTRSMNDIPTYIDNNCKKYWAVIQEVKSPKYYTPRTVIHYDEFVESRKYRQKICDELKGAYSEDRLDYVPPNGFHSSFDGKKYQGKGSQMNVLDRVSDIMKTDHKDFYLKMMKEYARKI